MVPLRGSQCTEFALSDQRIFELLGAGHAGSFNASSK
jgi:hypothetical protein